MSKGISNYSIIGEASWVVKSTYSNRSRESKKGARERSTDKKMENKLTIKGKE
jgi:hypothetical protein